MSIKKKFLPEFGVCRVFFTLPESIVNHAKKVAIVGDFNNWHPEKNPMKKSREGQFICTIDFPLGRNYQFRYLIDQYHWESEWDADALASTPYEETYNSVIHCQLPRAEKRKKARQ